jgi:hypothetical protein
VVFKAVRQKNLAYKYVAAQHLSLFPAVLWKVVSDGFPLPSQLKTGICKGLTCFLWAKKSTHNTVSAFSK